MKKQKLTKRILNRIIKEEKAKLSRRGILKEVSQDRKRDLVSRMIELEGEVMGGLDEEMIEQFLTSFIVRNWSPQIQASVEEKIRESEEELG